MTDRLTELIRREAELKLECEKWRNVNHLVYKERRVQLLNAQAELWAARKEREKEAA